jgi:hypothetical protein
MMQPKTSGAVAIYYEGRKACQDGELADICPYKDNADALAWKIWLDG